MSNNSARMMNEMERASEPDPMGRPAPKRPFRARRGSICLYDLEYKGGHFYKKYARNF
jgi:hypothetical protein